MRTPIIHLLWFVLIAPAVLAVSLSAEEPGLPALGPVPHSTPLAPPSENETTLSPDQRLQRQLHEEMRERDRMIEALKLQTDSLSQPGASAANPVISAKLEQPRKDRDQAWDELQRSLHAFDDSSVHAKHDVLDAVRPAGQLAQIGPLSSVNQLRVATCYQELASSPNAAPADVSAGFAVLDQLNPSDLPESERTRYQYLRVWFLAEQARTSSGAPRAKLVKAARAALQVLQQMGSASELATTASSLLIDLNDPPAEKGP
jgi:hypothetical protein